MTGYDSNNRVPLSTTRLKRSKMTWTGSVLTKVSSSVRTQISSATKVRNLFLKLTDMRERQAGKPERERERGREREGE